MLHAGRNILALHLPSPLPIRSPGTLSRRGSDVTEVEPMLYQNQEYPLDVSYDLSYNQWLSIVAPFYPQQQVDPVVTTAVTPVHLESMVMDNYQSYAHYQYISTAATSIAFDPVIVPDTSPSPSYYSPPITSPLSPSSIYRIYSELTTPLDAHDHDRGYSPRSPPSVPHYHHVAQKSLQSDSGNSSSDLSHSSKQYTSSMEESTHFNTLDYQEFSSSFASASG